MVRECSEICAVAATLVPKETARLGGLGIEPRKQHKKWSGIDDHVGDAGRVGRLDESEAMREAVGARGGGHGSGVVEAENDLE